MVTALLTPAMSLLPKSDQTADEYIRLELAPAHIPGRPHRATVWRWAMQGLKRDSRVIRLRTTVAGGRRFTKTDWIAKFLAECNADEPEHHQASVGQRDRQAAAAVEALAQLGVSSKAGRRAAAS